MTNIMTDIIRKPKSRVFKRAYIKRRDATTGLFETDWQEVTDDITKWGKIKTSVDFKRQNKLKFNNLNIVFANDSGRYNPEDDRSSLWYGFANQQRTLFKIETGFIWQVLVNGVWENSEHPTESLWDNVYWDRADWDGDSIDFQYIVQGDINSSDKNKINLVMKPITQVFLDYPAQNLTGWTSTGMTASKFVEMLRDQTDGSSNFVFRPFFGDTTTNWEIQTTTTNYADLNTSSAENVIDSNCWEILEKLSEAEQYIPYVKSGGVFKFAHKNITTSTGYHFFGQGLKNTEFGTTIKSIKKYNRKVTDLYTRVQVKFDEADTETSYSVKEASMEVTGTNLVWNYGWRTLSIDNNWIADLTTAATIADSVFDEVSSLKREIHFNTSFVPHLNVLEEINISHDSSPINSESLWDLNDWDTELIWDSSEGDSIYLNNKQFKLFSISLDLDKFESSFIGREA